LLLIGCVRFEVANGSARRYVMRYDAAMSVIMSTSLPLDDNPFASPIAGFMHRRVVSAGEIDALGHVNNVCYVAWLNDVAIDHWNSVTSKEQRARSMWFALRHEIDYKAEAREGEFVIVKTWTGSASGLRYRRHTQITRERDAALLAEALTLWCPMDAVSRKPARPPADIAALFAKS
jgi:acyl-CoA thioester hydrolase